MDVFVGRTRNELCPVAAVLSYLAVQGSSQGPLFTDTRQQLLTKTRFVARIISVLDKAGNPSDQFAGHSFRIGAAKRQPRQESRIEQFKHWGGGKAPPSWHTLGY